jgi:hypothetical protein
MSLSSNSSADSVYIDDRGVNRNLECESIQEAVSGLKNLIATTRIAPGERITLLLNFESIMDSIESMFDNDYTFNVKTHANNINTLIHAISPDLADSFAESNRCS